MIGTVARFEGARVVVDFGGKGSAAYPLTCYPEAVRIGDTFDTALLDWTGYVDPDGPFYPLDDRDMDFATEGRERLYINPFDKEEYEEHRT